MCGIIGFNWEDQELLRRSLDKIVHRGRDNSGKYADEKISLGHRRLSIVDLSRSGKQPMSNKEGTLWIVFNGEIYNHSELRKELEKKYDFKSNTDTEVLIYLYEEYEEKFLDKLQGMFVFCIYDSKNKKLFLARDRAGIKPLYYLYSGKKFMFCSEIKGILEDSSIKREINLNALSSFLTFRANTEPETIFNGIKKLSPGHSITYNLKTNSIHIKKYWDLSPNENQKSFEKLSEELILLLESSVRSRLMADVPYGSYLSGGVDSGTITYLMQKYAKKTVNTFSVGFSEEEHSESKEAKHMAEKLGTKHRELIINSSSIKNLPKVIYHLDEPMSDPTSIPIYLLSKYAKKYATVILTGEGSDELFAGYPQYKFMKLHNKLLKKIPKSFRKLTPEAVRIVPNKIKNSAFRFSSQLGKKGIERFSDFLLSDSIEKQYLSQVSIFNENEQSEILSKKTQVFSKYKKYFENKNPLVTNCQILDFKGAMVEDLLMKVDKNTMAFGVEGRVPFLDHRLIEFSFSIPSEYKLQGFSKDKIILRKSFMKTIPNQASKRKKRHFFVPIDSWLSSDLSSVSSELFGEKFLRQQSIFNPNYINKIKSGFKDSPLYYSRQLWSLLTFQIWYKTYINEEEVKI